MATAASHRTIAALDLQDLAEARRRFLEEGEPVRGVRPPVAESWRRSVAHGVDPHRLERQERDPEALGRALEAHQHLVAAAEPLLAEAGMLLGDLPHLLVVAAPDARVLCLWAQGISELDREASNLFEGASWHESAIGCNGIGTALAIREPVVLVGPEHFQESYVGWTCVGVPVWSPAGELVGATDLSVPNGAVSLATWGWTLSLGRRIGQALGDAHAGHAAAPRPPRPSEADPLAALRGVPGLLGFDLELRSHRRLLAGAAGHVELVEADLERRISRLVAERNRSREGERRACEARAFLSHELRTPVATIRNAAALLEDTDPATTREAARQIGRQAAVLARLADDLDDFERLERAETLASTRLCLRDRVVEAVALLQPEIDARRHDLSVKLTEEPLWVRGDAVRLQQIFVNLLTNAARYTPAEGRVAVSVFREVEEAVVQIADDGNGIPAEHRQRIFEPFQRLESGSAPRGSGIGLAVVEKLVRLHGGRVSVASEGPGRGSVFTVRLPLEDG